MSKKNKQRKTLKEKLASAGRGVAAAKHAVYDLPVATARMAKAMTTKDSEVMSRAVINYLDKGLMSEGVVRGLVIKKLDETINKACKKAKPDKPVTIEKIMEALDGEPTAMKLYEKVGLSRDMLRENALDILRKRGMAPETEASV